jgi:hypothetical protein
MFAWMNLIFARAGTLEKITFTHCNIEKLLKGLDENVKVLFKGGSGPPDVRCLLEITGASVESLKQFGDVPLRVTWNGCRFHI